jgi:hypothetical protein
MESNSEAGTSDVISYLFYLVRLSEVRLLRVLYLPQTLGSRSKVIYLRLTSFSLTGEHGNQSQYPIFNILRDLIDRSKCNQQSLGMVILYPEFLSPNGIHGLSRSWDIENVHDHFQHRAEFIEACGKVQEILRGALFEFQIPCDTWNVYLLGGI